MALNYLLHWFIENFIELYWCHWKPLLRAKWTSDQALGLENILGHKVHYCIFYKGTAIYDCSTQRTYKNSWKEEQLCISQPLFSCSFFQLLLSSC